MRSRQYLTRQILYGEIDRREPTLARWSVVTDQPHGDDINHPLITLTGLLIEAESLLFARATATLRSAGIAGDAFEVLLRLSRSPHGRLRMSELSRQLTITTGGASRMMERLERDGLVRRVPSTADRRVVYAEVTDTGRAELERVIGPHLDDLRDIFTVRLRPDHVADLERGLRALRDALVEDRPIDEAADCDEDSEEDRDNEADRDTEAGRDATSGDASAAEPEPSPEQ